MQFIRKKRILTKTIVFYQPIEQVLDEAPDTDILIVHQSPTPSNTGYSREFTTLHVDLHLDKKTITSGYNKTTRYQIRRARDRDDLTCLISFTPDRKLIDEFILFYDRVSAHREPTPCDFEYFSSLSKEKMLILSAVSDKSGTVLARHALILASDRARLYKSASLDAGENKEKRALIGRANRLLHAEEIIHCKDAGLSLYDFGGISLSKSNRKLQGIDRFKMGFGGAIVTEFHCYVPMTILGWIASLYLRKYW